MSRLALEQITETYGVPARKGARVRVDGHDGTVIDATWPRDGLAVLRVKLDDGTIVRAHPAVKVDYLPTKGRLRHNPHHRKESDR